MVDSPLLLVWSPCHNRSPACRLTVSSTSMYPFHAIILVLFLAPSDVRYIGSSSSLIGVKIPIGRYRCVYHVIFHDNPLLVRLTYFRKSEGLTSRNDRPH
ncbi:hypothetical protein ARMSODRAFT_431155 [Armillaria solidipes]|uniref:Uncharacterized protein n=1 Tax=Armillaria solidipes TaxID=1076256 RepID=A0A2H3B477_9AGAR|nr:hypothetical protein ARMSODRAFT_431155 [Armillaria solidipes]